MPPVSTPARKPIPKISKKKLARLGGKMPFSTIASPRKAVRKVPWEMCRTCHRKGTPSPRSVLKCSPHPVGRVGDCGQCGKRRPLVTCHSYDFRAYSFRKAVRKSNPIAKAKRDKRYKAHLSSVYWKALRQKVWKRTLTDVGLEYRVHLCENCEEPLHDIGDMQLAHLTYARFGHELDTDVQGQCKQCNQTEAALRGKRIRRSA